MTANTSDNKKYLVWLGLGLVLGAILAGWYWLGRTPPAVPPAPSPTASFTATPKPPTSTPKPSPTPVAPLNSAPTAPPTATPTPARLRQSDRLSPLSTPTATVGPTPAGLACAVAGSDLNLREGPGTAYKIINTLAAGAAVQVVKQVAAAAWVLVETGGRQMGWVYGPGLTCPQNLAGLPEAAGVTVLAAAPAATAMPVDTPTPAAPSAPELSTITWRAEYFDNASLLGEPVLVRQDPLDLNFNWYLGSPAPEIPADNFSVRWTRLVDFYTGGDFRVFVEADDGVRVYVDNQLVIDNWNLAAPIVYQGGAHDLSPGFHEVRVEYFESGGYARIKLWGDQSELEDERWQAEYFANPDLQPPDKFTRRDKDIDFDWGEGSPDQSLPHNDFSVRWRRKLYFAEKGDYTFTARVEKNDQVRILLDGWLLADEKRDEAGPVSGTFGRLQPGFHTVTVEYIDHGKQAEIEFTWGRSN